MASVGMSHVQILRCSSGGGGEEKIMLGNSTGRIGFEKKVGSSSSYFGRRRIGFVSSRIERGVVLAATTVQKPAEVEEIVLQPIKDISGTVNLPGSKSLSNRILLLAALAEVISLFISKP